MSNSGWILTHRKMMDCWVWENPLYLKAWMYLLYTANHSDKKILFDGEFLTVKRGQLITSQRVLAEKWGCSLMTARKILDLFKQDEMVTVETDKKKTLLTVVNYDVYQLSETDSRTVGITPTRTVDITVDRTPTRTVGITKQLINNNSMNEENNVDELNEDIPPLPPTGEPERNPKKKSAPSFEFDLDSELANFNWSDEMKDLVKSFYEYRKEIKKPFKSIRGIQSLLKEIDEHITSSGEVFVDRCINRTMANGWQGIFYKLDDSKPKQAPTQNEFLERLKDL